MIQSTLYPFKGKFHTLSTNINYHYLDEGTGDPVVMLHGNPTWSFYYRNLTLCLKKSHRCIVPDHIGCGLSDKPGDNDYQFTLDQRVKDLESLIRSLNLTKNITLILHDWGGMIGMAFANKHSEKIKRIVLLNTAAFHLPKKKQFPFLLHLARTKLGKRLILNHNAFSWLAVQTSCKRKKLSHEIKSAYMAPYNNPSNRLATLRFVQDIPLEPNDPSYDTISNVQKNLFKFQDLPILICWGNKDFVFDHHFLNEWKHIFPMAQIHEFKDCGHYILEDASDDVIPIIEDFIRAH